MKAVIALIQMGKNAPQLVLKKMAAAGGEAVLIVALVAWFVRGTLMKAWEQIGQQTWHWPPFWTAAAWLAAAGGIYLVGLLPAATYWHYILRVLGQDVHWSETLKAYYIGHLGKYVPGKALVVVIRTGMVRSQRVNTAVAAVSVFVETLTLMAVGAFLAAGVLACACRENAFCFGAHIGLMIVSGFPVLPPVFRQLTRLVQVGKSDAATAANLARLKFGHLFIGFLCMTLSWLLMANSLWATFRAIGITDYGPIDYAPEFVAAVALALAVGFLSFIPAGLGVRDLVLVELLVRLFRLGSALPPSPAACSASFGWWRN